MVIEQVAMSESAKRVLELKSMKRTRREDEDEEANRKRTKGAEENSMKRIVLGREMKGR
jgi:hypothetical protein